MATEEKKLKKKKVTSIDDIPVTKEVPRDYFESEEWYIAKFVDAEVKQGQYGPYLNMKFKVLNGETETGQPAKGKFAYRMIDATIAPKKPLYDWVTVFRGGVPPKEGEKIKMSAFFGMKVRAFIKDQKKKKGSPSDKRYQLVDSIKALKKKSE